MWHFLPENPKGTTHFVGPCFNPHASPSLVHQRKLPEAVKLNLCAGGKLVHLGDSSEPRTPSFLAREFVGPILGLQMSEGKLSPGEMVLFFLNCVASTLVTYRKSSTGSEYAQQSPMATDKITRAYRKRFAMCSGDGGAYLCTAERL